ncbi:VOC family protein [soil metagenome]
MVIQLTFHSGMSATSSPTCDPSRHRIWLITLDLFAGIPVGDYERARAWYEQLLGSGSSFVPTATEAVWELAEHRFVFIEERPEHAGHAMHTIFVDDLDARIAQIASRGIEPAQRETYSNGVRKATYRDPDGNEIGFGGAPI